MQTSLLKAESTATHKESHTTEDSGTVVACSTNACEYEEFEFEAAFPFCPGCHDVEDWRAPAGDHRVVEEERERERVRGEKEALVEWMMFWGGLG